MRRIARVLLGVVVALLAVGALIFGASESGEVVVLSTTDQNREVHRTRLWTVEHDGALWLRAGTPTSGWLKRIHSQSEVVVERNGVRRRYRAKPSEDAGVRDRIHELMAKKYGWADSVVSLMRDGSRSVPVRLESLE